MKANLNTGKEPLIDIAVYSENGILENCTGSIQNAENVARPDANDFLPRAAHPPKSNRLIAPHFRFFQFVQTPNGKVTVLPDRDAVQRLCDLLFVIQDRVLGQ
jgi:hypothetical protein